MVSAIQSTTSVAAAYQTRALAGAATQNSAAAAKNSAGAAGIDPEDLITLTVPGQAIARSDLTLPSPANLQRLEDRLNQKLGALFAQAGISTSPPISFAVDPNTSQVTVTSDRPDAKEIEDLINKDPALKYEFHSVDAEASNLSLFQKGLQAIDAYQAAKTKAERDAAVSQYYANPLKADDITLSFDGTSIQAEANGKPL